MKKKITLYYDMDNTVALWCEYGKDKETKEKALKQGFFRNLPVIDGSVETIKKLYNQGYEIKFLTACEDTPFCRKEKQEWIKEHFSFIPETNLIMVPKGVNKADYIEDIQNSLLVDDYGENLKKWVEAGGIAIKKVTSGKRKQHPHIVNHNEIFTILKKIEKGQFVVR